MNRKRKIGNCITVIVLSLCLLFVSLAAPLVQKPVTAMAASLNSDSFTNGGTLTLTEDSTLSGQIQINSGTSYTLDLNGYTLTMQSSSYFMLMGGTLTIKDSSEEQTGIIYNSTYLVWFYQGGIFNLESGTIDGTYESGAQLGGAVWMQGNNQAVTESVFNMTGGTIQNCTASQYGGAVYVGKNEKYSSTFNMSGGTIKNCSAGSGGAIYIDGGTDSNKGIVNLSGYVVITGNTATTGGAIYDYGTLNVEGYLYIDGTVYLNNAWEGSTLCLINVTGELCVLGQGYIDVDTSYYYSAYTQANNTDGSGYTVVYNASGGKLSDETFYTYASYFYNSTRSMGVLAGYESVQTAWTQTNHTLAYTDVMGGQWVVSEAKSSESGSTTPAYQSKEYLIYAEGYSTGAAKVYYSIKMMKYAVGASLLDGAEFTLYQEDVSGTGTLNVDGTTVQVTVLGTTTTGSISSVGTGTAYFMEDGSSTQKLMLTNGTYYLVETAEPSGYTKISQVITITINGDEVTVNGASVNASTTGGYSEEQNYYELVFSAYDLTEPDTYTVSVEKYDETTADAASPTPVSDVPFTLNLSGSAVASGTTGADGTTDLYEVTALTTAYEMSDGTYTLSETAVGGYYAIDDITLIVASGTVTITGSSGVTQTLSGSTSASSLEAGSQGALVADTAYGSWTASLDETAKKITVKVYDEPQYQIQVQKYSDASYTTALDASATFNLYDASSGQAASAASAGAATTAGSTAAVTLLNGEAGRSGGTYYFGTGTSYVLKETPPAGYYAIPDISIAVAEDGTVTVGDTVLNDSNSYSTSWSATASGEYGGWKATYSTVSSGERILLIQVYDQEEPKTVTLTGVKYGTQIVSGNELAGAEFKVYDSTDTQMTNPLGSATSASDGTLNFLATGSQNDLTLSYDNSYLLAETTAPEGYAKLSAITITIDSGGNVTVTQGSPAATLDNNTGNIPPSSTSSYYTYENNVITLSLVDETVYELPESGGNGIYGNLFLGMLLASLTGGAWICLRIRKRGTGSSAGRL
ncbi:MAG: prealbumin-like fold domain-containing protein [Lachnospiraceae bacterium]|nr:prealbumin-like fold domain-containing protein [Lachnospiraceae bacterium]